MQCCAARQNTRLPVAAKLPGPEPATEPAPAPAGDARLRAELEGLKLSALRRRARDTGASEKLLDDAGDCDHPREGLIALVIQMAGQPDEVGEADPASALLREELGALKFSMLRKRALALGIDAARLEEADDEEDPRAATIELTVASAPPPPSPVDPDSACRAECAEAIGVAAPRQRADSRRGSAGRGCRQQRPMCGAHRSHRFHGGHGGCTPAKVSVGYAALWPACNRRGSTNSRGTNSRGTEEVEARDAIIPVVT